MKLKFTNGKDENSEINIKNKCTITNYDTRERGPEKASDLTVNVDNKSCSIMVGQEEQENSTTVNLSQQKYSIFTAIAGMDGDLSELTQDDIEKAKENFDANNTEWETLAKLGVTSIRYDSRAGVATIVIGENEILRIDFETKIEKLKNFFGIENNEQKSEGNEELNESAEQPEPYDAFVDAMAQSESSGIKTNVNRAGYVGLFQFGEEVLADLGIYRETGTKKNYKNNDWSGVFIDNEFGITSLSDFKLSADKQKKVFEASLKKNWSYITSEESNHLEQYIGKEINGQIITEASLLAGAHLVGIGKLKEYLDSNGSKDVQDGNGVSVATYIKDFANYDLSNITGVPFGTTHKIEYKNVEYVVSEGDTLEKIAKQFNTSIDRIVVASGLDTTNFLKIGQKLIVPAGQDVVS